MSNKPSYLIFTDLDGTLLDHFSYSHAPADQLIPVLQHAGIPIIINTSKTFAEVTIWMNGTPSERPSDYQSANPAAVKLHPKTQLLQGTADNIVPVEQTRISGATVRLVEGAGHFDWLHYQSEAFRLFHRTLKEITSDLDR